MMEWILRDCFSIVDVLFIGGACTFIGAYISCALHGDYQDEENDDKD